MKKPFYRLRLSHTKAGGRDVYKNFKRKRACEAAGQIWLNKLMLRSKETSGWREPFSAGYRCKKITTDMWWVK